MKPHTTPAPWYHTIDATASPAKGAVIEFQRALSSVKGATNDGG